MRQLEALQICKTKPWYSDDLYLNTWNEYSGVRYAILTPTELIGWGMTWNKAIADADKQFQQRGHHEDIRDSAK